jgi:hypothetical protein
MCGFFVRTSKFSGSSGSAGPLWKGDETSNLGQVLYEANGVEVLRLKLIRRGHQPCLSNLGRRRGATRQRGSAQRRALQPSNPRVAQPGAAEAVKPRGSGHGRADAL